LPLLAPRRFEIGRNGAYDLSVSAEKFHPRPPWHKRRAFLQGFPWISLPLALALSVLLLWHFMPRLHQAVETAPPLKFSASDTAALPALARRLKQPVEEDKVTHYLNHRLSSKTSALLSQYQGGPDQQLQETLAEDLDRVMGQQDVGIYDPQRFDPVSVYLWPETRKLLLKHPKDQDLIRLNRLLLEDAYPLEIAERHKVRRWTTWACIISLLTLLFLGGVVFFDHFRMEGQPFSLTQGISVWPTELIRVVAAGLAAVLFFRSRSDLLQTKQ